MFMGMFLHCSEKPDHLQTWGVSACGHQQIICVVYLEHASSNGGHYCFSLS